MLGKNQDLSSSLHSIPFHPPISVFDSAVQRAVRQLGLEKRPVSWLPTYLPT